MQKALDSAIRSNEGKCFRLGIIITIRLAEQKELEDVNPIGLENQEAKNRKHTMPHWSYVAIGTFLYAGIWSYIGILKILSLNAYVFDLGINSERGWQILHTNLGLHGYLSTLINSGIVFPLSPLTGSGNFFAMIIFQAFSVAIVGPAIYFIAKEKGMKSRESMLISFAFFLYFPVYGIMWFDFHYQVFFMPLFLFAYLLYLRKNYVASTLLFFLSGIVRYPYSIFPLAFASTELFLLFRNRQSWSDRKRMVSMTLLLNLMVIWTVLGFLVLGMSSTIPHSGVSQYTGTAVTVWSRFYVILLFLSPLLFLPVMRARWIILALPAFYLFLSSSYTWYTYPHVFQGQYAAGIAPFLFLGLIDYLALSAKRKDGRKVKIFRSRGFFPMKSASRTVVVILVILLFLNMFFAPFSPLNNQFGDRFNFQQNTSYNPLQYTELVSMLKMVPPSQAYVAYQNNIPELFPRAPPPGDAMLMGGFLGSFTNVSVNEAIKNSWQVNAGGSEVSMPVNFAIADALNPNFYLDNNSAYSMVHDMYESGKYGILSEGYGLILLQRGYNGTIENYAPENVTIPGSSFSNSSGIFNEKPGITPENTTQIVGEYVGTPLYLFPGQFTVTIYFNLQKPDNATNVSSMIFAVYSGSHALVSTLGNLSVVSGNSDITEIMFTFSLNEIAGNVWYSLYEPEKNSSVSMTKIVVTQKSPFKNSRVFL